MSDMEVVAEDVTVGLVVMMVVVHVLLAEVEGLPELDQCLVDSNVLVDFIVEDTVAEDNFVEIMVFVWLTERLVGDFVVSAVVLIVVSLV